MLSWRSKRWGCRGLWPRWTRKTRNLRRCAYAKRESISWSKSIRDLCKGKEGMVSDLMIRMIFWLQIDQTGYRLETKDSLILWDRTKILGSWSQKMKIWKLAKIITKPWLEISPRYHKGQSNLMSSLRSMKNQLNFWLKNWIRKNWILQHKMWSNSRKLQETMITYLTWSYPILISFSNLLIAATRPLSEFLKKLIRSKKSHLF